MSHPPEVSGPQRLLCVGQTVRQRTDRTLRDHALAQGFLQGARNVALRHPARIPLHEQPGEDITGPPPRGPQLRAIWFPQAPALGQWQPQNVCGGFHGALLIPMAIAVGEWRARVAAPTECLRLFLCQGRREPPFGRQADEGTQQLLATLGGTLAFSPVGNLLRFLLTGRSLPCPTGDSFFLGLQPLIHADLTREEPLVPPPLLQEL
jgi:hypothetical protein